MTRKVLIYANQIWQTLALAEYQGPLERAGDLGGRHALNVNSLAADYRGAATRRHYLGTVTGLRAHYYVRLSGCCLGSPLRGGSIGLKGLACQDR